MKNRVDTRGIDFASPEEKARYLDGIARLEAHQREVVQRARLLFPGDNGIRAELRPLVYLQRAHAWVRDNIRYVRDSRGVEHLADSATILRRKYDDCDGKSRVFVALALAGNRFFHERFHCEAAILPIFPDPYTFAHVQAACRFRGFHTGLEQKDGWIVAELCLEGVPLGSGLEAARWKHGRPVVR